MPSNFPVVKNRCSCCIIPDTYPAVTFDQDNVCQFCRSHQSAANKLLGEAALAQKIGLKRGTQYDVVVGISGGKDSCYAAYIARKVLNLRVLAVCYDFPFMVELARQNVRMVCGSLGIDLKVLQCQKDVENKILRNHLLSLMDTGTTWGQCIFCHYGIEAIVWRVAVSHQIPFILSGVTDNEIWWNPGNRTQLLSNHLRKLSLPQKAVFAFYQIRSFLNLVGQRRQFPIPGSSCLRAYQKAKLPERGPETIRIFEYVAWNQTLIEDRLRDETGWRKPDGPTSWRYDCILEPLLDFTYRREFGISSAGLYLCGLIRNGDMTRNEALGILALKESDTHLKQKAIHAFESLHIPARVYRRFFNGLPTDDPNC